MQTQPELDPRIEPPHSYFVKFTDKASFKKAENFLLAISDHFCQMKHDLLAITVGLTKVDLAYVIHREGAFGFKIIEIDGFETVDTRTDEDRMNDILEIISSRGIEFVTTEDRSFLRGLAEKDM